MRARSWKELFESYQDQRTWWLSTSNVGDPCAWTLEAGAKWLMGMHWMGKDMESWPMTAQERERWRRALPWMEWVAWQAGMRRG